LKTQILILAIISTLFSCSKNRNEAPVLNHKTENVIVIVMDGARYSETWGDPNHSLIPNIANNIAPKGVVNTNFNNNGSTYTSPGHLAICSGQYYNLNNGGTELPPFPTIFQYFNKQHPNKSSWIITSKDKLEVLNNTSDSIFNNQYLANTDCGIAGLGSGYRNDSITLFVALNVFTHYHPNLTLINFREPDYTAHQNDLHGYLYQIQRVDSMINIISNFIMNDPTYKDNTTVFITNDHGRHDDLNGGFMGHGDNCNGCKHLLFAAYGPDFKKNQIINTSYELLDIANTIGELLDFEIPNSDGEVMQDIFK